MTSLFHKLACSFSAKNWAGLFLKLAVLFPHLNYGFRLASTTKTGGTNFAFFKKKAELAFSDFPKEDSNPHDQNQNLRCYHYTIGECNALLKYFFS